MKPFNLYQAMAGYPVCTRDGRRVKIWRRDTTHLETPYCLEGATEDQNELKKWTAEGKWVNKGEDDRSDLFMAEGGT